MVGLSDSKKKYGSLFLESTSATRRSSLARYGSVQASKDEHREFKHYLLWHLQPVKVTDLEIWVRGHSRSLKPVPFESLGAVSYSPSVVTMVYLVSFPRESEILVENCDFFILLAFDALVRMFPSKHYHTVWYEKK